MFFLLSHCTCSNCSLATHSWHIQTLLNEIRCEEESNHCPDSSQFSMLGPTLQASLIIMWLVHQSWLSSSERGGGNENWLQTSQPGLLNHLPQSPNFHSSFTLF
jgi:hypothetical protein